MFIPLLLAALITGEVPITSRSPEAVKLYLEGRDKALNFDTVEAVALFRKAVAADPDFALALGWLGKLVPGPEGGAMTERAAELAKGLSEGERISVEVMAAERKGEDERVRGLKRRLADLAPNDWLAQFQMGVQSMYDHKSQATILYLTKALKLNPGAAEVYNYLGYVLVQQGQIEDGIAKAKRFVELKPQETNSYDSLGEVLLLAGKLDEAEAAFRKGAELSPGNWMSWMGAAYARFFRGDWDGGRAVCRSAEKYITLPPDKLAVEQVLAWSFLAQGQSEEALHIIDGIEKEAKAKKQDFNFAWAALERAEMLAELHRFGDAMKQLGVAEERGKSGKLTGAEENRLRRSSLILQARMGSTSVAERALAQLEGELAAAPSNNDLRGLVRYAEGLVALVHGQPEHAVEALQKCPDTFHSCFVELAAAEERAGAKARATETLRKLGQANMRDNLHRGEDPSYLFVSAALKGHGPLYPALR